VQFSFPCNVNDKWRVEGLILTETRIIFYLEIYIYKGKVVGLEGG
jgi:hypothetical protein